MNDKSASGKSVWSMPMALSWVMWRDFDRVSDAKTFGDVWDIDGQDEAAGQILTYSEALERFLNRAADGELPITMVHQGTLELVVPSPEEWAHLSLDYDSDLSERFWFTPRRGIRESAPRYRSATIRRADVLRLWEPRDDGAIEPAENSGKTAEQAPKRRNRRPQDQDRVKPFLDDLWPHGIPDRSTLKDADLIKAVGRAMENKKQIVPSRETLLRAAGRKE
ncbi:hypothetical protein [Mesorhizobium sp. 131-2-1]|uniref:hypothetical protein n=1 Tax=Mesorhizobium sp. 131-2-1 TaxID=2744518 RepID=UPI0019259761|nr:hypothetical protein [Mesorhizobium sp. 131-2-1]BCG91413.1 hypothetical protein MesoLj131a_02770 [Mesorhizobium sp. 131-2-1]